MLMEDYNLSEELSLLEEKIKQLLDENKALKLEIVDLKKDKAALRDMVEKKVEEINNFQNQIKISKIVDSMAVEDNATELKYKINEYIKDIDKCIAQLSR